MEIPLTAVPAARRVLADVAHVRSILEDEPRAVEWRLNWILAVVLLRSVGHVLSNVDGGASGQVKELARKLHHEWKSGDSAHAIFRDFIERERNSILKEYAIAMSEGPIPIVAYLRDGQGAHFESRALIEENIYRPIADGPYEGEDGRTVLDDAIDWWRTQLARIDGEMGSET